MSCCNNCGDSTVPNTCGNPCGVSDINTATCETIPSQIENFTTHFFGEVTKTEVNGIVTWNLPCELEVGLQNNPRIDNEGLACYFLRLFNDGIVGATGPEGAPGEDGANGRNAYTVTLATFAQPDIGSPNIQILVSYNPAIIVGMFVFISTSGFYEVTALDNGGNLWLTLTSPLLSAPASITAGKLVVPCGHPGESVVGPPGPAGPIGPQGTSGVSYTSENAFYTVSAGSDYYIPTTPYDRVTFVLTRPEVTLTKGMWLITANVEIRFDATYVNTETVRVKLRDVTTLADVVGSVREVIGWDDTDIKNLSITVLYYVPSNNCTIALYAEEDVGNHALIIPTGATISAVKLED